MIQKWRKWYSFFALILMLILIFSGNFALADGLKIKVTPDKESYQYAEKATVKIEVINENDWEIMNLEVKNEIPDSVHYCEGHDGVYRVEKLMKGEKAEFSFEIQTNEIVLPQTGDFSHPILWISLIAICVFGCICLNKYRGRNGWICVLVLLTIGMAQNLPTGISSARAIIENQKMVETVLQFEGQPAYLRTHFSWEEDERISADTLSNLMVAQNFISLDEQDGIVFTVEAETAKTVEICLIDENGARIAEMYDDGHNGDTVAGDGIYACTIQTDKKKADRQTYYAQSGHIKSNAVTLCFYEPADRSSYQAYIDICDRIMELEAPYLDENNFVKVEYADEAVEAVRKFIADLYEKKIVLEMYSGADYITFRMYDALEVVYMPQIYGVSASGMADDIYVFEAMSSLIDNNSEFWSAEPEEAAKIVSKEFDIAFSAKNNHFNEKEVTVEAVRQSFQKNSIILYAGHGTKGNGWTGIVTGEEVTEDSKKLHDADYTNGRLAVTTGGKLGIGKKYWVIKPGFIKEHCDLENSFVFVAACYSGCEVNTSFMDICCIQGATYAGYDGSVNIGYSRNVLKTVVEKMCQINPQTDWYYSLDEAAEYARKKHGDDTWLKDSPVHLVTERHDDGEYYFKSKPEEEPEKETCKIKGRIIDEYGKLSKDIVQIRCYTADGSKLLKIYNVSSSFEVDNIEAGKYYLEFECIDKCIGGAKLYGWPVTLSEGEIYEIEDFVVTDFCYFISDEDECHIYSYTVAYDGDEKECIIPSSISGYPITAMGNEMFENCSSLQNIEMPDNIMSIGRRAFAGCTSLTSVHLPKNLRTLDDSAFYGCKNLNSIYIYKNVRHIGDSAFKDCAPDLVIYGEKGSYAEAYANEHGIEFSVKE